MRMTPRTWLRVGVAALATVATLVAGTGVAFAAERKWQEVHLRWNVTLRDADNDTQCTGMRSKQYGIIPPDSHPSEWYEMLAADWEESCDTAVYVVSSRTRRNRAGLIEVEVKLNAIQDNVHNSKTFTLTMDPSQSGPVATDVYLDGSSYATAAGHFSAGTFAKDDYQPRWAKFRSDLNRDDVQGHAVVEVYRSGQYIFDGHLHNGNFASKDVKMTCAVVKTNGEAMSFEIAGDLNGTLAALGSNKSFDWKVRGESNALWVSFKRNEINEGSPLDCVMSVETDIAADVAGGAVIVLKVAKAVFS
jgi:hypothetical protein